jgi:predicted small secreted protein
METRPEERTPREMGRAMRMDIMGPDGRFYGKADIICGVKPKRAINDRIAKLMFAGRARRSPLGGKMKNKTLLLWSSLLVVLALEGCATVRGMGEDIQSLGRAIKRAVSG